MMKTWLLLRCMGFDLAKFKAGLESVYSSVRKAKKSLRFAGAQGVFIRRYFPIVNSRKRESLFSSEVAGSPANHSETPDGEPLAITFPSGETAKPKICILYLRESSSCPVATSHSFTILSPPVVANRLPSGKNRRS